MARAPVKRFFGTLLLILGAVLFFGFWFLLFADAENIESVPFVDQTDLTARVVGVALGTIAIILAIMILVRAGRDYEDDEDMFFIPEKDRVRLAYEYKEPEEEEPGPAEDLYEVYQLASVKRQEHAWEKAEQKGTVFPYYFPRSVERGLYANDYITIDPAGTRIKLRTLIAGPKGAQRADTPAIRKRHIEQLKKQEEEKRLAEEAKTLQDVEPGDGGAFMSALEQRASQPSQEDEPVPRDEVFYGYPGDNPYLDRLEGLDPDAVRALKQAGVTTAARLLYEDPGRLARKTGYQTADVARWQSIAELRKVPGVTAAASVSLAEAGIRGISDLTNRSATDISDEVEKTGGSIPARRIEGWQESARGLKRTKQRVPAS